MTTTQEGKRGLRVQVQRFGSFLSGMVMPNIGAFIAWGDHHGVIHSDRVGIE